MPQSLTQSEADALQIAYIRALDRRDMPSWMACFSKSAGAYTCIGGENEDQGLPLALMLDDCPARLQDRVKFVTEVWVGTFEDYQTRHFVQRLEVKELANGSLAVQSNFVVAYTTMRGASEILVTGIYDDIITVEHGAPIFTSKKAILDTTVTPRYLVYPV